MDQFSDIEDDICSVIRIVNQVVEVLSLVPACNPSEIGELSKLYVETVCKVHRKLKTLIDCCYESNDQNVCNYLSNCEAKLFEIDKILKSKLLT